MGSIMAGQVAASRGGVLQVFVWRAVVGICNYGYMVPDWAVEKMSINRVLMHSR
jgi:hypothetical protein